MARRYRPSRRPSAPSLAAIVFAGAGAALLLALLWPQLDSLGLPYLGTLGDLAFVGIGLRGLAIGALLAWVCRRSGFSRPGAAALVAGLAVVGSVVGAHYVAYQRDRADLVSLAGETRDLRSGFGHPAAELDADYAAALAELSFANHLRRHFGLLGPGADGASKFLGPAFGIGLFSAELLVGILLAMYWSAGQASEPVCKSCGAWLCEKELARAKFGQTKRFIDLLLGEAHDEAMAVLARPDTREYLELSVASCPHGHDKDTGVLRLRDNFIAKRGRVILTRHRGDLVLSEVERARLDAQAGRLS